jgi:hypothetical protein
VLRDERLAKTGGHDGDVPSLIAFLLLFALPPTAAVLVVTSFPIVAGD